MIADDGEAGESITSKTSLEQGKEGYHGFPRTQIEPKQKEEKNYMKNLHFETVEVPYKRS